MDNGKGRFEAVTPSFFADQLRAAQKGNPNRLDKIFNVNEQIQIKDSRFLVRSIDHLTGIMTLKLLPEKEITGSDSLLRDINKVKAGLGNVTN